MDIFRKVKKKKKERFLVICTLAKIVELKINGDLDLWSFFLVSCLFHPSDVGCHRGHDCMVVGFITTYVISAYHY
jgi:hypothetical protein